MFNYINSWKSRKKPQWNIEVRLGRLTLLQLNYKSNTFRFMILNYGLEINEMGCNNWIFRFMEMSFSTANNNILS